jgi:hypothetical protein
VKTLDFSNLERFISAWGLPSVEERIAKRTGSTLEEMKEFHDAILPGLESLIDFLNQFPCERIPAEYLPLKNTVLCALHIDRPVNKWKKTLLDDAGDPRLFKMKTSFYDSKPAKS